MSAENGNTPTGPLELSEVLYIETKDGKQLPFEVVGILEDPEAKVSYAVLAHEPEDGEAEAADEADGDHAHDGREFIVTDLEGNLVDDDELAQEVLDEFLLFAEEAGDAGGDGSSE